MRLSGLRQVSMNPQVCDPEGLLGGRLLLTLRSSGILVSEETLSFFCECEAALHYETVARSSACAYFVNHLVPDKRLSVVTIVPGVGTSGTLWVQGAGSLLLMTLW